MKHHIYFFLFLSGILFLSQSCGSKKEQENSAQTDTQRENLPSGVVHYTAPEVWIAEHPSSSMRRGQYRLPGKSDSDDGILAIYNFPGTGGSVEANLERWYKQMVQPDGSETKNKIERRDFLVNGMPVTLVYVTGTYLESATGMMMSDVTERPNYAMLAAIVETANSPWFFKATGPKVTIDTHRQAFEDFVKTIRVESKKIPS
jgi:hypothetical protein